MAHDIGAAGTGGGGAAWLGRREPDTGGKAPRGAWLTAGASASVSGTGGAPLLSSFSVIAELLRLRTHPERLHLRTLRIRPPSYKSGIPMLERNAERVQLCRH